MTPKDAASRAAMPGPQPQGSGRNPQEHGCGVSTVTTTEEPSHQEIGRLMEEVVERKNMQAALRRVTANKGAPGVDAMSVEHLKAYLRTQWPRIKEELLRGEYHPSPVRRVYVPKPSGGVRPLGIPIVLDRLIQQALLQVLSPHFDPHFSERSYGFRPGRSAHQAVLYARDQVAEGRRWVVDLDLEKCFDRINHDLLMARVARRVKDKRMLRLVRRYLQAGVMENGLVSPRTEGTPQGGPLSPLLSNILLDDLDRELEKRGHVFCRYADDCNIYVRSRRAGERVLLSITEFLAGRLKLTVNQDKSAVDRPWKRTFLGYSMTVERRPRLKVASASVRRLKGRLRRLFRSGRGRSVTWMIASLAPLLRGWAAYYRLAATRGVFEDLDGWLRRRMRLVLWRQWKRPFARATRLMRRGLPEDRAWRSATNGRGPWWNSGASHMNAAYPKRFFDRLGLPSLLHEVQRFPCAS
jgi:RNA-directed DNA polymerase